MRLIYVSLCCSSSPLHFCTRVHGLVCVSQSLPLSMVGAAPQGMKMNSEYIAKVRASERGNAEWSIQRHPHTQIYLKITLYFVFTQVYWFYMTVKCLCFSNPPQRYITYIYDRPNTVCLPACVVACVCVYVYVCRFATFSGALLLSLLCILPLLPNCTTRNSIGFHRLIIT